jgi:hypothetical protein
MSKAIRAEQDVLMSQRDCCDLMAVKSIFRQRRISD